MSMDKSSNRYWNFRQALRDSAAQRKCPDCGRKGALSAMHRSSLGVYYRECRWCKKAFVSGVSNYVPPDSHV